MCSVCVCVCVCVACVCVCVCVYDVDIDNSLDVIYHGLHICSHTFFGIQLNSQSYVGKFCSYWLIFTRHYRL